MKTLVAWSGGKDSALALWRALGDENLEVVALLTTVTVPYGRVTMHGVRRGLLRRQAAALGMALEEIEIPSQCSHEDYDRAMGEGLAAWQGRGLEAVVFGDVFLEDVRQYREERLAPLSVNGLFPLWGDDSAALARQFVGLGFKAVLTCVDTQLLDGSFAGRDYNGALLADLPPGVDPCGENGEFHTFVWDGPPFTRPVGVTRGATELREGRFRFQDLLPAP